MGKTWKQGLEPTERQKAIEFKLEKESGCVLLKFLGKERRNGEISRNGVSLKKTRAGGEDWESSPPTQGPTNHQAAVQPLPSPHNRPASASSVRLKHETRQNTQLHKDTRSRLQETDTLKTVMRQAKERVRERESLFPSQGAQW